MILFISVHVCLSVCYILSLPVFLKANRVWVLGQTHRRTWLTVWICSWRILRLPSDVTPTTSDHVSTRTNRWKTANKRTVASTSLSTKTERSFWCTPRSVKSVLFFQRLYISQQQQQKFNLILVKIIFFKKRLLISSTSLVTITKKQNVLQSANHIWSSSNLLFIPSTYLLTDL